jgi:mono/diheme cytochrome c family protein
LDVERCIHSLPIFLIALLLLIAGCRPQHNMEQQPYYKPDKATEFFSDGTSSRQLVAGTVPRPADRTPGMPYVQVRAPGPVGYGVVASSLSIPFPITAEALARGQERFNIYCAVCHGRLGDGNGMIPQRGFQRPPSFHTKRLIEKPDAHFYNVITNGYGTMFSYADRVSPDDRWKITAYIRALQTGVRDAPGLTAMDHRQLEGDGQ